MLRWITPILLALALAAAAYAQVLSQPEQGQNGVPMCSANYDATGATFGLQICAGTQAGRKGWVNDGLTPDDCTTGTGSHQHMCISQGDGTFKAVPQGTIPTVVTNAATLAVTAANMNLGCNRYIVHNNGDADGSQVTLPAATAGMCITVVAIDAQVITIEVDDADIITLGADHATNGVKLDEGDTIDSTGDVGDSVTLLAIDATEWVTIGMIGIWIDGGAT
jgi:hypothetical protein